MSQNKDVVIGIDLGTTNSLLAHVPSSFPQIIEENNKSVVPSIVYKGSDSWIVGDSARPHLLTEPENTLFSIKRLIGKSFEEVEHLISTLPYVVRVGECERLLVEVNNHVYSPEEISAEILKELKARAERHFGHEVTKAVITVPAYFDDVQRQSTKSAARLAGLEVLRIINEPTAAALAYGMDNKDRGNIVVYDLGGGTFDVSILSVEDGVFQVLATSGDTLLGGDDFDNLIMDYLMKETDASTDPFFLQNLRIIAEQGKKILSSKTEVDLIIQKEGDKDISRRFTRQEFEKSIDSLIEKTIDCCKSALKDSGLDINDIDEVILVGGSTRVPLVRDKVNAFFKKEAHSSLNPDEVVAMGAAVQGHILAGGTRDILLLDVTPLSLGIETVGGTVSRLIQRNVTLPIIAEEEYTTYADNQTGLDIHIVQGERDLVRHCRSLGRFRLTGFPPSPAGVPLFKVVFSLDSNGVLTVDASEQRSGVELNVKIQANRGLAEEEVEQMLKDSVSHSHEDFQEIRQINICNEARVVLKATKKSLNEVKDNLPENISEDEYSAMTKAAGVLENYLDDNDTVMVEFGLEELNTVTTKLADTLISQVIKNVNSKSVGDK